MNYNQPAWDDGRPTQGRLVPQSAGVPAPREPYGELGSPYGADPYDGGAGLGADMREYWRILSKRKWVVISIALAVLTLGAVRTLMMTPLYEATVRLQIDRNVAKVVEGGN